MAAVAALLRGEEFRQFLLVRIFAANAFVVGAEFSKDALVAVVEPVASGATFVVDDGAPTAGLEDADKLRAGAFKVEPVECLADSYKVGAMIRQGCGFGRTVDACQFGILRAQIFARGTHGAVRLNRKNGIAVLQKKLGQHSCACANVGDNGGGSETAVLPQQVDHLDWIARAKLAVRVDAAAETLLRIRVVSAD